MVTDAPCRDCGNHAVKRVAMSVSKHLIGNGLWNAYPIRSELGLDPCALFLSVSSSSLVSSRTNAELAKRDCWAHLDEPRLAWMPWLKGQNTCCTTQDKWRKDQPNPVIRLPVQSQVTRGKGSACELVSDATEFSPIRCAGSAQHCWCCESVGKCAAEFDIIKYVQSHSWQAEREIATNQARSLASNPACQCRECLLASDAAIGQS